MIRYLMLSSGPALVAAALLEVVGTAEIAGALGIAVAVVVFFVAELHARRTGRVSKSEMRRDVVHALLSAGTAQLCLVTATALLGFAGRETVTWSLAVQVVVIVVGSDFLGYWAHRAQHRIKVLWAPHALHHSPDELYWLNGLRAHPGDAAWAFLVSTLWVLVAGFTVQAFAVASVVLTSHLLLQHTRLSFPRWLERLFVTPAWHRVHHDRAAGKGEANLGQVFTLWDRWFGTFRPSEPAPAELGLDVAYPRTLAGELALPWTVLRGAEGLSHRPRCPHSGRWRTQPGGPDGDDRGRERVGT